MPGFDGTGPCGMGALTGRQAGNCRRPGRGFRRGYGNARGISNIQNEGMVSRAEFEDAMVSISEQLGRIESFMSGQGKEE